MSIPDDAAEAAGRVISSRLPRLTERHRQALAREILEAAAPHLMAQAWDEGVQAKSDWTYNDDMDPLTNPYRSQP